MGGYYHRNVIINIPSGAWGTPSSIPASVIPGQKVSFTYTYTLPSMTNVTIPTTAQFTPKGAIIGRNKPMDIWLIGFVAKNSADATKRDILNVGEQQMWNLAAGVSKIIPTTLEVTAYPNPANNAAYMEFTLSASEKVTVTVTNSLGQVVNEQIINKAPEGLQSVKIATESLANGIYNVSVVSGGFKGSSKLMVTH